MSSLLTKRNNNLLGVGSVFTGAKVLIVGDSNAGKSALIQWLTTKDFTATVPSEPTWIPPVELPIQRCKQRIKRKIWLWDFAGHSDYRLIHQVFLDNAAIVILVFDPQKDNVIQELTQWDRDLNRIAKQGFRKLLVAGRVDKGKLRISEQEIQLFCSNRNYDSTSRPAPNLEKIVMN